MKTLEELHHELDMMRRAYIPNPTSSYHSPDEMDTFVKEHLGIYNFPEVASHSKSYVRAIMPTLVTQRLAMDDALVGVMILGFLLAKYESSSQFVPEL